VHEKIWKEVLDSEGTNEVEFVAADEALDEELEAEAGDIEDFEMNAVLEEGDERFGDLDADMETDTAEDIGTLKAQLLQKLKRRRSSHREAPKKKPNTTAKIQIEYEQEHEKQILSGDQS